MAILSGGIARAVIRAALPSLIRDGLTGVASIAQFRSWGYGIRRQDFYGIFRSVTAEVKQIEVVKGLDKFKKLPLSQFDETDWELSRKYLYDVEFDIYDEDGEYVDKRTFSYSSDKRLEPAEVEEIMEYSMNETTSGEEGWQYANPTLIGAIKK